MNEIPNIQRPRNMMRQLGHLGAVANLPVRLDCGRPGVLGLGQDRLGKVVIRYGYVKLAADLDRAADRWAAGLALSSIGPKCSSTRPAASA